jgi:hypothetical protein
VADSLGTLLPLATFAALLGSPAAAHEFKADDLQIEHPWARPTVSVQKNGAAYLVVRNLGGTADRLLGASSPEAERIELHDSTVTADGVARMHARDGVEIPAGGEVKLAPGGQHLMLVNLRGRLFEGTDIPITLVFERAGEVPIEVMVERNSSAEAEKDETEHGQH